MNAVRGISDSGTGVCEFLIRLFNSKEHKLQVFDFDLTLSAILQGAPRSCRTASPTLYQSGAC